MPQRDRRDKMSSVIRNLNTPCPVCDDTNPTNKFDAESSAWCIPCSNQEQRVQEREPHPFYNPYSARKVRRTDKPSTHK